MSEIPAPAFLDACKHARRSVDHPAKLIPYIVRESEEYARHLKTRLWDEENRWRNRNAPKLECPPSRPDPIMADREEVSELMRDLIATLKGKAVAPDEG